MKKRWIPGALLATLLFGLTGCDKEPFAAKVSPKSPIIVPPGSLEPLVEKAWSLMDSRKYDECTAFIDTEFSKIESKARQQEQGMQFFPELNAEYRWHVLDGAGNLLRVKQESLKRQGKHEEAVLVWEMMFNEFPHFQCWRVPTRFWRPAFEARRDWQAYRLLKAIKERKLSEYEYLTDSIFDKDEKVASIEAAGLQLLDEENFDGIEYASEFFISEPKWREVSRSDFSNHLINGCASCRRDADDSVWTKKKQLIERWIKAKPDSSWAPLALATFWIDYAWKARGSGYANTVTEAGWQKFGERINMAHQVLEASKRDCPLWYAKRLKVCMAESAEPDEIKSIFTEGINKYPWFQPISTQMIYLLLPRWLGRPGDWEDFATTIGKEQGAAAYLHLCLHAAEFEGRDNVGVNKNIDWLLLKEGFEQQIKENPDDLWLKNSYAAYAWWREDQAAGKRAFRLMNNMAHPDVWAGKEGYLNVKRWAEK